MKKELSMTPLQTAGLLGCALIGVALLAVFGIVPETVARYAPLTVVPFLVSRQPSCRLPGKGKMA